LLGADLPEIWIERVGVHESKVGAVENVEELEPQLQIEPLREAR
jgi:hypothetical protein